ncbi:MAG: response regulator transcription factor [Clostridiales Family XIII bacterium]|jgi:DNA-binding NarL/FixJ family response regulator|nr:response regulator transcription factor [Clostridiales Family XIII bacterium]
MIRIIIADDDPIILQGLSMILGASEDIEVLGEGKDGAEAVRLCREYRPDVALLDIRMPGTDGIEAAETILKHGLAAPLLLTTFDEPNLINRALKAGAQGYILKNSPPERILSAIETVARGGAVFAPDVIDYIRSAMPAPAHESGEDGKNTDDVFKDLTPREQEVVAAVAEGLSNQEIAERLFLSNGTVRNHISVILEKTGLDHRTQIAIRWYAK